MWAEIIERALPVVDFYLQVVSAQHDLATAKGKSALVREVMPLLREIEDRVERHHYVGQLARIVKVDERALLMELDEAPKSTTPRRRPAPKVQPSAEPPSAEQSHLFGLEEYSLTVIVGQPQVLATANDELLSLDLAPISGDDYQRTENQQLFLLLSDWIVAESPRDPYGEGQENGSAIEHLVNQCDPLLESHLSFLLERWGTLPGKSHQELAKDLVANILLMRSRYLKKEVDSLRFLQDEAEESHDEEQRLLYQTLANTAKEQLRTIYHAVDRRSIHGRRRAEAENFGAIRV